MRQLAMVQVTQVFPDNEKVLRQVPQVFVLEHDLQFATLHWVHVLAPPASTVNPGAHNEQKFCDWQFRQFVTLHWMQLPPKVEIENPVAQFEQKLLNWPHWRQLATLHSLQV